MLSKETNETNLGHLHSLLFTFAANMKLSLINQINSSVGLHKKTKGLSIEIHGFYGSIPDTVPSNFTEELSYPTIRL